MKNPEAIKTLKAETIKMNDFFAEMDAKIAAAQKVVTDAEAKAKEIDFTIRTEIREVEKHIKSMAPLSKDAQIAIISKAQSMVTNDEHSLIVLILVKNRIIREA